MSHRPTGPACGNNPNHPLTDGDRHAVADFKAYLTDRAALQRVRAVLEAEPVVGRSALEYRGLITSALMADSVQPSERPDADLPARLEATLTERYTESGNPFSRMRRQEKGPDGWPAEHPVGPHHVAEVLRELLADETQPAEAETEDPLCICMHRRSQHPKISGRLLCDECDPDSTENLVCKEFEAL
jgi:hypothetical protein